MMGFLLRSLLLWGVTRLLGRFGRLLRVGRSLLRK
jgi:hypothetical protein